MSFFNYSGFHSPPSRPLIIPSPTSPFCTSPSQLQEVTLDQDNTFSSEYFPSKEKRKIIILEAKTNLNAK
ncbi:Peptide chain release factor 1-like, mitochondrial [Tribolium castaneum]|uniref:Peptide chain release factor 1-like, mitochondrial n=1 Tax=Tribolium castaneum TaxID=7070 RepID=A0A139WHT2_TRICA|nr:Peptide chain release factor 1-like, mitochondrial [Tribolium castaneum]